MGFCALGIRDLGKDSKAIIEEGPRSQLNAMGKQAKLLLLCGERGLLLFSVLVL